MDKNQTTMLVRTQIEKVLGGAAAFDDGDRLGDHGLDSLSVVELTLNLEEVLDITFEDEELAFENFATLGSIVALAETKLDQPG
ncbi:acyl carrier protein [Streptomyces sp. NPDC051569]|uniref:acyl carrier protein n=1 Tax=Streptomyces sp. NPDC051569 TaxID=3365661 RepID=UPI00379674D6